MSAPSAFGRCLVAALLAACVAVAPARSAPAPVFRGPPPAEEEAAIAWTGELREENYAAARTRFSRNYARALRETRAGRKPDRLTLEVLAIDLKALSDELVRNIADTSPPMYIES